MSRLVHRVVVCGAIVAILGIVSAAQADVMTPITVTGFNQDVIARYGAAAPMYDVTCDVNGEACWVWAEAGSPGFGGAGKTGLPYSGPNSNPQTFTSEYNASTTFLLQSYAANNTALTTSSAGTTLTLTTPDEYKSLAILSSGGYDATTWQATLHFSDTTTTTLNSASDPAFNGTIGSNAAISGIGFVYDAAWDTLPIQSGGALYEHDFALSSADQLKTLNSITFTSADVTNIYGVSGEPTPEPSAIIILVTGLVGLLAYAWRKRR